MAGEVSRILGLPRVDYGPCPEITAELRLRPDARPLLATQTTALGACKAALEAGNGPDGPRGVLCLMGCGDGKTLVGQLAPVIFRSHRPLVITKASLIDQLHRDIIEWRSEYPVGRPQVMSYGKLSHPSGQASLDLHRPDLIILDEAHVLANPKSARGKRFVRYVASRRHSVRVVAMTGSLANRSLLDLATVAGLTLRDWVPMPTNGTLGQWAAVLDVGTEPTANDYAAIRPLQVAFGGTPREAFRKRLHTAPGVVVTAGAFAVGVSLSLARCAPKLPAKIDMALRAIDERWELPDGTWLVDALEYARNRRTVRLGFYYRWRPDTVNDEWFEARREWSKVVRSRVEYGHYDSPWFVVQAAEAGRLDRWELARWSAWQVASRKYPPPEGETIWIDPHWIGKLVTSWRAEKASGGLVWYRSRAVAEAAVDSGWPVYPAGGEKPKGDFAFVSLGHATGWNGQAYNRALVLEMPASARQAEQLLSRHHRRGQTSDVRFDIYAEKKELEKVARASEFVSQTTGQPMRWLLADWR